jgi:hypothetical protein
MHATGSRIIPVLTLYLLAVTALVVDTQAFAAGDGTIVIQREVQPRVAFRPTMVPDPNPVTVNPNISPQVKSMLDNTELSDGDFARIITGNRMTRMPVPDGHLPGLNTAGSNTGAQGVPGLSAGHAGGGGNSIANQVNRGVQQGLAPLRILTGDR